MSMPHSPPPAPALRIRKPTPFCMWQIVDKLRPCNLGRARDRVSGGEGGVGSPCISPPWPVLSQPAGPPHALLPSGSSSSSVCGACGAGGLGVRGRDVFVCAMCFGQCSQTLGGSVCRAAACTNHIFVAYGVLSPTPHPLGPLGVRFPSVAPQLAQYTRNLSPSQIFFTVSHIWEINKKTFRVSG